VPDDDRAVARRQVGDSIPEQASAEAGPDPVGVDVEAVHLAGTGRDIVVRARPGAGKAPHRLAGADHPHPVGRRQIDQIGMPLARLLGGVEAVEDVRRQQAGVGRPPGAGRERPDRSGVGWARWTDTYIRWQDHGSRPRESSVTRSWRLEGDRSPYSRALAARASADGDIRSTVPVWVR
jgi:hypothetical protein